MPEKNRNALGARMKERYERRAQTYLPRRTYTIVRLDGRAFHTYTSGLEKPYDLRFAADMQDSAHYLCTQISGVAFAYTQSDEISLLLTDFANPQTEAWFDGNVQKIVSLTASMLTEKFNYLQGINPQAIGRTCGWAQFDSRAFTIPDLVEVQNYFVWRQQDAVRNSISSLAQAHFPHSSLQGVSQDGMQEMLWRERGVNWNDCDPRFKRGTVVVPRIKIEWIFDGFSKLQGEMITAISNEQPRDPGLAFEKINRRVWEIEDAPHFVCGDRPLIDWVPGTGSEMPSG